MPALWRCSVEPQLDFGGTQKVESEAQNIESSGFSFFVLVRVLLWPLAKEVKAVVTMFNANTFPDALLDARDGTEFQTSLPGTPDHQQLSRKRGTLRRARSCLTWMLRGAFEFLRDLL